ncbi:MULTISPECIES: helix-turn-helix domain-containing protein [Streptomyces]|uniref:helix-turn-helix domain-containing protein n=1 Tax=Streptomyces TaxID=1883 RepID=UPI001D1567E8|nr:MULTISPECIES: pyridoxamine 5'-phosphate oxidase family protein [Streptomyces]MCC3655375.1 pyridoxamine 5'-phosphate oxidase family protein [Streptomyces sp. S07_1.15]WSQ70308.1 pyridoxamine 5'-phosphate oxidase family protein [Streptomyces xinghaiensis]
MSETENGKAHRTPDPGDIGRRITLQRERLGLTREEAAARAGMAPGYLAYLEEHSADPSAPGIARLAGALGTSVDALRGAGTARPAGRSRAAAHPRLVPLDADECWSLLSSHGVGRIGLSLADDPVIIPVNYVVEAGRLAYRTAPGTATARAAGHRVAFEVDAVDDAMSRGWSVLVVGRARHVTEPDMVGRLAELTHAEPWAGGVRDFWVLIDPERLSGRRIETD